ncbi:MAG: hypothetical protein RRX92_02955 [Lachnospiraceae bacterium]
MATTKKKVTRIMKVTLEEDEFEKFDRGETHSANGLRGEKGKLSALPDIAPILEHDLPTREVVRTKVVYEPVREEPSIGVKTTQAVVNIVGEVLSDPEIQESIALLIKTYWHYKVKPKILTNIQQIKDNFTHETKASRIVNNKTTETITYQFETKNESGEKIAVTGEQAEQLLFEFRQKAKELSAMIFILSSICVKNEKTQKEYALEQFYLKQLASEESISTMLTLAQHKQLLDEGTALCLSDFLKGYVRSGEQLVKIPINVNRTGD